MSESVVSTTVAFLFGGMVFLLTYTRLGGLATTLLAAAILVGYLLIEAWHALSERRAYRRTVERLESLLVADAQRNRVKR